jgi:hypothetical protein
MAQIGLFSEAGIDFLEISGGTYEDPTVWFLIFLSPYMNDNVQWSGDQLCHSFTYVPIVTYGNNLHTYADPKISDDGPWVARRN